MAEDPETGSAPPVRWLPRWMVGVGVVYLVLAVNLSSLLVAPERVYQFFPPYDAPLDGVAFAATADGWFLVGLTHAVVGAFLLWGSRRPRAHAVVVPFVVAMELVAGIAHNLYLLFLRDYPVDAVYYGFVVLHVVVIATGYFVYRGEADARVPGSGGTGREGSADG